MSIEKLCKYLYFSDRSCKELRILQFSTGRIWITNFFNVFFSTILRLRNKSRTCWVCNKRIWMKHALWFQVPSHPNAKHSFHNSTLHATRDRVKVHALRDGFSVARWIQRATVGSTRESRTTQQQIQLNLTDKTHIFLEFLFRMERVVGVVGASRYANVHDEGRMST